MGVGRHAKRRNGAALAGALILGLGWLPPLPALAQAGASRPPGSSSSVPAHPEMMTTTELQGVSCIALGTVTAAGALYYSTTVTLASFANNWGLPLLAVPIAAGGYAVGCNIGSTTGPGLYWIYAWLQRR